MDKNSRRLKNYLYIFGLLNIIVISFAVPLLLGNWLMWQPRNFPVEMMMSVVYLAMGIVMIRIAKDPVPHKAFVDFLVLVNLLHALVMLIYAETIWQILFDVGGIALMGTLPLIFYPWGVRQFLRY